MPQTTLLPTETVYYLYGLVQADTYQAEVGAQLGILARVGQIIAVGAPVSRAEFGPEEVTRSFNDLDWVSKVATAHYEECARIFCCVWPNVFLPFRLCTVFSSVEVLQQFLEERQADFIAEIGRLTGKAEFGLKISVKKEWLEARALATDPKLVQLQVETKQESGKAFFARKRLETEVKESQKKLVPKLGRRLTNMITQSLKLAEREVRNFAPVPPADGYVNLLNLALLLSKDQEEQLLKVADVIDREVLGGALVIHLGPLPPFSFISLGTEGETSNGRA
jgi:hypothetical protein